MDEVLIKLRKIENQLAEQSLLLLKIIELLSDDDEQNQCSDLDQTIPAYPERNPANPL